MNYIPNTDGDRAVMLEAIGVHSADALFESIPQNLRSPELDLPRPMDEQQITRHMLSLANRNANVRSYTCFLGAGAYNHFVPAAVRYIVGRSEFSTAYTPYQPEISQGTLQTIFEYQSAICQLTGMDAANASMYDGASAAAEAVILAQNVTGRRKVVVAPTINPEYMSVIKTYLCETGSTIACEWGVAGRLVEGKADAREASREVDGETACLLVQHPSFFGYLEDLAELSAIAQAAGALFVVVVDPVSLALLKPPGDYSADIAVGEGQPLGNTLSFGGPYLGLFAVKAPHIRQMPGRIVGQTTDYLGRRGYVLTLQTREQHIRRERASSNICSNEALNALAALTYMALLGKQGMRMIAADCLRKAHYAAARIAALPGFSMPYAGHFFKEFVIRCPISAEEINAWLLGHRIIGGYPLGRCYPELEDCLLLCVTEVNTREEIDKLVDLLARARGRSAVTSGDRRWSR